MGVIFLIIFGMAAWWLWTLVNILKNSFTGNNKIIWLLVVLFIPPLGVILYATIGYKQKIT